MKKIITTLLSLAMVITMMPAMAITAFAGEGTGTLADLQNIVDKAGNGSTIVLEKDYAPTSEGEHSLIWLKNNENISKSITIDLNGHSIKSNSYCFWIESEQKEYPATLTLIDSKGTGFLQNIADDPGSDVVNIETNGRFIAKGILFKGNSNSASTFYTISSAAETEITIEDCSILGGDVGIYNVGSALISNTKITNTKTAIKNVGPYLILENSTITGNTDGVLNENDITQDGDVEGVVAISDTQITNNEYGFVNEGKAYLGGSTRIVDNSKGNLCLTKRSTFYPEGCAMKDQLANPVVTLGKNKKIESLDNYLLKKPNLKFKAGVSMLEYETRFTKTRTVYHPLTGAEIIMPDFSSIEIVKDGEPIGGVFLTNGNALNAKLFFADNSEYKINCSDGQLELISEAEANKLLVKKAIKGTIVAATCICYIKNLQKIVKVQGVVHNLKAVKGTLQNQLAALNTVFKGAKTVLTFAQFKLAINNLLGFKQFESR